MLFLADIFIVINRINHATDQIACFSVSLNDWSFNYAFVKHLVCFLSATRIELEPLSLNSLDLMCKLNQHGSGINACTHNKTAEFTHGTEAIECRGLLGHVLF